MTTPTFCPGDRVHLVSDQRFVIPALGINEDPARRLEGEVLEVESGKVSVILDRKRGTVRVSLDHVKRLWASCDTEDCPGDREAGEDYCYDCIQELLA